ncbi:MAG TPA: hypothetical protein VHI78_13885 [Bacteroidales bacterium]|nr:hypothetical protein [Bacteroidales bacterium]
MNLLSTGIVVRSSNLLLIPLIFLFTSFVYVFFGGVYLYGVDPEFNYLFNGISLAHLKLHLNAVGHPGTPIQILIAIVAQIVHLFRPGQSIWDDVMLHPEFYIKSTIYTANVVNALFLLILGYKTYKYTKSMITAMVLQISPFAFLMTLEISFRLMPELIMISLISCWIILLVKMIYEPPEQRNIKKYSLLFGILFGISLADKLTFITFFFLPMFLLPGILSKIRYSLISIISFALFAFPAMLNFHKFSGWVTDIFIHKGPYGTGAEGVVDWQVFFANLSILLKNTLQLWIPLLITLILAFFSIRDARKDLRVRLAFGIATTVILHYAITSKHYAFYYFTPSLLFTVFLAFLSCLLIGRIFPQVEKKKFPEYLLIIFTLVLIINVLPKLNRQMSGLQNRNKSIKSAMHKFEPYLSSKEPKIVCAYYYGGASIEYSLLFGLLESGKYKRELNMEFQKHYPSTIIYLPWADSFYDGVNTSDPDNFLVPDTRYILYIADYSQELLNKLLARLNTDKLLYKQEIDLIEKSDETREAIYSFKLTGKND